MGEIQEKLSSLRENKARNEATVEGINNRKKDLMYSVKNELGIESDSNLFASSDLINIDEKNFLTLKIKKKKLRKQKRRELLGSVNLRADEETKRYEEEIKKMEDDRSDLYSAIVKLKASIEELNQKEGKTFRCLHKDK